jgi:sensor histidine kinase YesM
MLLECLLCSVLVAVAFLLSLAFVIQDVLALEPPERWSVPLIVKVGVVIGPLMAGIWATAFVYPHWAEQSAQRGAETERLQIEADHLRATAELAHLRSQVEPHFLLNTLNMIAGLITQDPKEARRLIGCLGDLLRNSLHDVDEMQSLASEVVWLERYAELLESRHGNVLRFSWDIAPEALAWTLPRLLLQPLVENAVRHGALCREGGGHVTLSASVHQTSSGDERLVCMVSDNGPGLSGAPSREGGVGLRSVRRRLQLKYVGAELRMRSSEKGTQAIVELPATLATQPPPSASDVRSRAVAP